jgi:hypothetical protein
MLIASIHITVARRRAGHSMYRFLLVALVLCGAGTAHGDSINWQNTAGGEFSTPSNWNGPNPSLTR